MRRITFLLFAGFTLLQMWHSASASQLKILPGSAKRGEQLLRDKGCTGCHSLNGKGGNGAPDLARTPQNAATPEMLASAMWNHATRMWTSSESGGKRNIRLTSSEAADLFAYLYSVLYFAPPGDANRGKSFFEENCKPCHTGGPGAGSPISEWPSADDPVVWAERMWNHSAEMSRAAVRKGVPRPMLTGQNVADLLLYLRILSAVRPSPATFGIGEPEQGLPVFERVCESCHSFGPVPGKKIDLLAHQAPATIAGYIAEMWNHEPQMFAQHGQSGYQPPKLQPGEMSNLIAFVFAQSYFFERGDSIHGRYIFESKGCANCHEQRRKETGAPDLSKALEAYSPITMTSAVWSHGPAMFQTMRQNRGSWPQFQGSEMADLIAYLNSRLLPSIAPR
jgi:cytochrome c2